MVERFLLDWVNCFAADEAVRCSIEYPLSIDTHAADPVFTILNCASVRAEGASHYIFIELLKEVGFVHSISDEPIVVKIFKVVYKNSDMLQCTDLETLEFVSIDI